MPETEPIEEQHQKAKAEVRVLRNFIAKQLNALNEATEENQDGRQRGECSSEGLDRSRERFPSKKEEKIKKGWRKRILSSLDKIWRRRSRG